MQVFQMVSVYNSHTMKLDIKNDLCCSKKFKERERERERESKHSWLSCKTF